MAGTTSGFAYGRHVVSPDSEQIEPSVTTSQKVKLCERGVNSRQRICLRNLITKIKSQIPSYELQRLSANIFVSTQRAVSAWLTTLNVSTGLGILPRPFALCRQSVFFFDCFLSVLLGRM